MIRLLYSLLILLLAGCAVPTVRPEAVETLPTTAVSIAPPPAPAPLATAPPQSKADLIREEGDYIVEVLALLVDNDVAFEIFNTNFENTSSRMVHEKDWQWSTFKAIETIRASNKKLRSLAIPPKYAEPGAELLLMATHLDTAMDLFTDLIDAIKDDRADASMLPNFEASITAAFDARDRAIEQINSLD